MSISAVDERELSMSRLLSAARKSISCRLSAVSFRLKRRIPIRSDRLQKLGARGSDIVQFQQRFNEYGKRFDFQIQIPVSGIYDQETCDGVAAFQKRVFYVLGTDGFVGPETARALRIKRLGS